LLRLRRRILELGARIFQMFDQLLVALVALRGILVQCAVYDVAVAPETCGAKAAS
jgi:hypothetical protein